MFHCMNYLRRLLTLSIPLRAMAFFLEIPYKIPMDAIVMMSDVFPELTSGSGSPVGGIVPLTTSAFITVCMPYTSVIPEANRKEKKSSASAAILIPL